MSWFFSPLVPTAAQLLGGPTALPFTDPYASTADVVAWASTTSVVSGALRATATSTDTVAGVGASATNAESTITVKTLTSGYVGAAGRIQSATQYYVGTVTEAGVVNIYKNDSGFSSLATATLDALPTAPFDLTFQCDGNWLTLFIDGAPVLDIWDAAFTGPGDWGSYISATSSVANVEVEALTVTDTLTTIPYPLTVDFTDTNGDPWPAPFKTDGIGLADIQSNKGRLQADSGSYDYHWALHRLRLPDDHEVAGTIDLPNGADEHYIRVFVGGVPGGNDIYNGYCLQLYPSYNGWNLQRSDAYSNTDLAGTSVSMTFATNDVVHFRVQRKGTTVRAKVWLNGDPEPATWGASATDATYTGRYAAMFVQSGTPLASRTALFDDLVFLEAVDDPPPGFPFEDDFTGTNGDPPDSAKWSVNVSSGSSAEIQGNKLRLSLDASIYSSSYVTSAIDMPDADIDFTFSVTLDAYTADAITEIAWRDAPASDSYVMEIGHYNGNWGISSSSDYSHFMSGAHGGVSGDTVHVRIQSEGNDHRVKIWLNGASEPGSWTGTATDSRHPDAGTISIGVYNNAATTGYCDIDFVSVTAITTAVDKAKVRVGGAWVSPTDIKLRSGGAWVTPTAIKARVGGAWVTVWP